MCDVCADPACPGVIPEGRPLPYIFRPPKDGPNKDEVVVTVTTPMGIAVGEFFAHTSTLPQLTAINDSPEGGNYFHWQT